MNKEKARFNMIEQQIRPCNVNNSDILELLRAVKREQFVPQDYQNLAYADLEIPLPGGQNMLSPVVEARILQELAIKKSEFVLEIGSGSGFMAALLAHCANEVLSVEILPELAAFAQQRLHEAGVTNATVVVGDAARGWSAASSYDVIVVSGGLPMIPPTLLAQLNVGGRLAAFVGQAPVMEATIITRVTETTYSSLNLFETYVHPLRNAQQPEPSFSCV